MTNTATFFFFKKKKDLLGTDQEMFFGETKNVIFCFFNGISEGGGGNPFGTYIFRSIK